MLPGMAVAALAFPAQAQVVSASYRSASKTEAILGGAPSALAAITAQQGGRPGLRHGGGPGQPQCLFPPGDRNYVRQPVSNDRPDVFNSVALSIGRSPLDARWNRVSGAARRRHRRRLRRLASRRRLIAKLEAVNSYVNARVRFVDDRVQFGVADRWMAASETLVARPRRLRGLRAGQARHAPRRRCSGQGSRCSPDRPMRAARAHPPPRGKGRNPKARHLRQRRRNNRTAKASRRCAQSGPTFIPAN